jgi:hypothetical protein
LPYPIDKNSLLGEVNIQKRELWVKGILSQGILSQHLRFVGGPFLGKGLGQGAEANLKASETIFSTICIVPPGA